jgi:hypothetical protein
MVLLLGWVYGLMFWLYQEKLEMINRMTNFALQLAINDQL